jgi:hypothetical protein
MSIAQGFMLAQEAQLAPADGLWTYQSNGEGSLYMNPSATNYANNFPGTQDFCWETWIRPAASGFLNSPVMITAWGSGGNAGSPAASNFALSITNNNVGSLFGFRVYALGSTTTTITAISEAAMFDGEWYHLAMSRSGTTISVWYRGQLYALLEDFTGDLSAANVGGDGYWISSGPTGDRDETYPYGIQAAFRNTRWTIGNAVYTAGALTITPPPLLPEIQPVTGTQWIWWPQNTTEAFYDAAFTPWIPDYNGGSYTFTGASGTSAGASPDQVGFTLPGNYAVTPAKFAAFSSPTTGTWTNNGAAVITSTGPTPVIGTTCADFTSNTTNNNISSTDSELCKWRDSFFMTMWFYVPSTITNESKTVISCEGITNGFVLNIGRPAQGLDWLSVYASDGTEVAYAKNIWARNAWNYITVQQRITIGQVGPISAWAGVNGDSYATNLNMIDATGGAYYQFGEATSVRIGSKSGSTVSCQMYLNLIQQTNRYSNFAYSVVYPEDQATIPVQAWQYRHLTPGETFTFQGTNGSTNIQPLGY